MIHCGLQPSRSSGRSDLCDEFGGSAATATDGAYWFVNGRLYTTVPPSGQAFWPLEPGTHTITCSDAAGRSSSVVIKVR